MNEVVKKMLENLDEETRKRAVAYFNEKSLQEEYD